MQIRPNGKPLLQSFAMSSAKASGLRSGSMGRRSPSQLSAKKARGIPIRTTSTRTQVSTAALEWVPKSNQNSVPPFPLPQGVIVREVAADMTAGFSVELPFHAFENQLCDWSLCNQPSVSQPGMVDQLPSTGSPHIQEYGLMTALEQPLQAVLLGDQPSTGCLDLLSMSPSTQVFTSSLHRIVLFAVANNFAGLDSIPEELVMKLLQHETSERFFKMMCYASDSYSARVLAFNLFKKSIKSGNASLLHFLLRDNIFGIELNQPIFLDHYQDRRTPIQEASSSQHTAVDKILLDHGADPNLFEGFTSKGWPSNALGLAIAGAEADTYNFELLETLVNSGCELSFDLIHRLLNHRTDERIMQLCISQLKTKAFDEPSRKLLFRRAFAYQDPVLLPGILEDMLSCGLDINFDLSVSSECVCSDSVSSDSGDPEVYDDPTTIIDQVVSRGDLAMVEMLRDCGARLTRDTLPCAIFSENKELVRYLLSMNAYFDGIGSMGISPLAAAIRTGDDELIRLIFNSQPLTFILQFAQFKSALTAAIEVKNWNFIELLLDSGGAVMQDVKIRDLLFTAAIEVKNWDFIELLLDSGGAAAQDVKHRALLCALRHGRVDIARRSIDPSFPTNEHEFNNALEEAIKGGNSECVDILLEKKAAQFLSHFAIESAIENRQEEIALKLIESGFPTRMYQLAIALGSRNSAIVLALLDHDVYNPINLRPHEQVVYHGDFSELRRHDSEYNEWVLDSALQWGDVSIVTVLVSCSIRTTHRNCQPLRSALEKVNKIHKEEILGILLRAGYDICNTGHDMTVLRAAVIAGDIGIVKYALELGADPYDPNAILEASKRDRSIFDLLLYEQARRYPKGRKGWGAEILINAIRNSDYDLFKKLVEAGADANVCTIAKLQGSFVERYCRILTWWAVGFAHCSISWPMGANHCGVAHVAHPKNLF